MNSNWNLSARRRSIYFSWKYLLLFPFQSWSCGQSNISTFGVWGEAIYGADNRHYEHMEGYYASPANNHISLWAIQPKFRGNLAFYNSRPEVFHSKKLHESWQLRRAINFDFPFDFCNTVFKTLRALYLSTRWDSLFFPGTLWET